MERTDEIRADALAQLKSAQTMIEEGRTELTAAHKKITLAQKLIDASADVLRGSLPHVPHVHPDNPR